MKRTITSLILLFLVIGVQNATAEEPGLYKGDLELSGRLGFTHSSLSDGDRETTSSDLQLDSFMGVFLSDLIQLGGTLFVHYSSVEGYLGRSVSSASFGIGPDIVFNFNNKGPVVPYIDLAFAVTIFSKGGIYGGETGYILPSIQGGLRVLIGNSAAANFGVAYSHVLNSGGYGGETNNAISLFAGFSVFP